MNAINRAALESLYFGDRTLFFESLAEDYVCHTLGDSPLAGDFVGAEGMRAHVAQMRELSGGTFKAGPRGPMLVDDVHALVPTRVMASRPDGRQLDMEGLGLWRFADGKVAEHWELPLDLKAFDAFWRD
jgi:ketosteroid isomerase-like protein